VNTLTRATAHELLMAEHLGLGKAMTDSEYKLMRSQVTSHHAEELQKLKDEHEALLKQVEKKEGTREAARRPETDWVNEIVFSNECQLMPGCMRPRGHQDGCINRFGVVKFGDRASQHTDEPSPKGPCLRTVGCIKTAPHNGSCITSAGGSK
jgi:hypothetical protein